MTTKRPQADIRDMRDVPRLASKVHYLLSHSAETDNDITLLLDIICTQLNVAICDWCREEWFTIQPIGGPGPRGDVRGLLVAGGATCTKCLDRLYEASIDFDEDEIDAIRQQIAHWLNRFPANNGRSQFGKDYFVQEWRRRFLP